ncbi:hypothetical protein SAMN02745126_01550 [Enhydrobacter aerosaccus]|uniref:Uncharacterized protein n=1 Tax=Enhydrobacter aerosaccus TaxID=225324 RepID=A0A1T4LHA9_9HYPH|nr:hypothetical protein [Enhydrobacter aerosaccus]SJZ54179.1 hypothetical protein SAMN02745126_01550 [Enhydrobacter aerosaccus]
MMSFNMSAKRLTTWMSAAVRCVAIGGLVAALAGCGTVRSSDSKIVERPAQKIEAVRIDMMPNNAVRLEVQTTSYGAVLPAQQEANRVKGHERLQEFAKLISRDFRDRFPALAAPYGLTVSPTAPAILFAQITSAKIACYADCVMTVTLSVLLHDGKKTLWQFKVNFGQKNIWADIDDQMFDLAATEMLEAMKKDGMIGK